MATLTVQTSAIAGTAVTWNTAAGGGDTFTNDGQTAILIDNADVSSMNLTIVTSQVVESTLAVDDRVIAVGAGVTTLIGVLNQQIYGSTVSLTYSSVTSLTVAIVKIA